MDFLRRVMGEPSTTKDNYDTGSVGIPQRDVLPYGVVIPPRLREVPITMPAFPVERVESRPLPPVADTGLPSLLPSGWNGTLPSMALPPQPEGRTMPAPGWNGTMPSMTLPPGGLRDENGGQRFRPNVFGYSGDSLAPRQAGPERILPPILPPLRPRAGDPELSQGPLPGVLGLPPSIIPPRDHIDYSFIGTQEGFHTTALVPKDTDKRRVAGITIGGGVDVGQMNSEDLAKLKLPQTLHDKLVPYIGLTGSKAKAFLEKRPLTISEEEAAQLTDARKKAGVTRLDSKLAAAGIDLWKLPSGVATAVASLGYNMGENIPSHSPKLTKALIKGQKTGDFSDVEKELRTGYPNPTLKPRRLREADYLANAIAQAKNN